MIATMANRWGPRVRGILPDRPRSRKRGEHPSAPHASPAIVCARPSMTALRSRREARRPRSAGSRALDARRVVLFPGALLRGEVFFERDLNFDWYLRLEALARALREGGLALWDPGSALVSRSSRIRARRCSTRPPGSGSPCPGRPATRRSSLVHLVLDGLGASRLARGLGAGRVGAPSRPRLCGVLSGPVQSAVNLRQHLAGTAWMPWVLLAADTAARAPGRRLGARPGGGPRAAGPGGLRRPVRHDAGARRRVGWRFGGLRRERRRGAADAVSLCSRARLRPRSPLRPHAPCVWWPAADVLSRSPRRDLPEDVRAAWSVPPRRPRCASPCRSTLRRRVPRRRHLADLYGGSRPPFLLALPRRRGAGRRRARPRLEEDALARAPPARRRGCGALAVATGPHGPLYPLLMVLAPPLRIFRYPSKADARGGPSRGPRAGLGVGALRRGRSAGHSRLAGLLLAGAPLPARQPPLRPDERRSSLLAVPAAAALGSPPGVVFAPLAAPTLVGWPRWTSSGARRLHPTAGPGLPRPPASRRYVDRERVGLYVYDYHSLPRPPEAARTGRPLRHLSAPEGWDARVFDMVALRLYLGPPSAGLTA